MVIETIDCKSYVPGGVVLNKAEQDAFWNAQVSKLKRASLLRQQIPAHQGYRQKLHSWKGGAITLNAGCDDANEWVHVDITMTGEFRLSWFSRLAKREDELKRKVEADLAADANNAELEWIWDDRVNEGESWIILRRHRLDLTDRRSCQEGQDWVTQSLRAFLDHLGPLLETM